MLFERVASDRESVCDTLLDAVTLEVVLTVHVAEAMTLDDTEPEESLEPDRFDVEIVADIDEVTDRVSVPSLDADWETLIESEELKLLVMLFDRDPSALVDNVIEPSLVMLPVGDHGDNDKDAERENDTVEDRLRERC